MQSCTVIIPRRVRNHRKKLLAKTARQGGIGTGANQARISRNLAFSEVSVFLSSFISTLFDWAVKNILRSLSALFGAVCLSTLLFIFPAGRISIAQEIAATPHRPAFGSNTATTHPSTFEFEAGAAVNPDMNSIPVLLKYGLRKKMEVFVGYIPHMNRRDIGRKGTRDASVGHRWRFVTSEEKSSSAAVQIIWKIPIADKSSGLGTGRSDFDLDLIMSTTRSGISLDLNLGGLWTGIKERRGYENSIYVDAVLSRSVTNSFTVFIDTFTHYNPDSDGTVVMGAAGLGIAVTPALIFDIAANVDIKDAPFRWQLLIGTTVNFSGL